MGVIFMSGYSILLGLCRVYGKYHNVDDVGGVEVLTFPVDNDSMCYSKDSVVILQGRGIFVDYIILLSNI